MFCDERHERITNWVQTTLSPHASCDLLHGDASFRRYFRVVVNGQSVVAMDAPPKLESLRSFLHIQTMLAKQGLCVPDIIAHDLQQGFLLLSDFGDCQYLSALNDHSADRLYQSAIDTLVIMQQCEDAKTLPHFDHHFMRGELALFEQWYIRGLKAIELTPTLDTLWDELLDNIGEQPHCFMHRDYHSRNLMLLDDTRVGLLDFQDAMWGPITYDLVSLLKDCYIDWPNEKRLAWLRYYIERANVSLSFESIDRVFQLTGVQRHLKAIGIFSRLYLRDGKPAYLQNIPRTANYILDLIPQFEFLKPLEPLLQVSTR